MEARNVVQTVPFFAVSAMQASLRFYVEALGFTMTKSWTPKGKILWCWLELGGGTLMLQEFAPDRRPPGTVGAGVSICFQCKDALALYHSFTEHGIKPQRPFVGNGLWVTNVTDPDGYKLSFQSPTDAAEESVYEDPSVEPI